MGVIRTGQMEQHELRVKKRCRPACTSTQSVRFLNEYCQCLLIAESNVSDQTVLISRFIRLCCALWLSIALVRYQCKTRCVWYSYSLHFAFKKPTISLPLLDKCWLFLWYFTAIFTCCLCSVGIR